jgi:hypothetical protein
MSEKRSFFVTDPSNYLQREILGHIGRNFPEAKVRVSLRSGEDKKTPITHVTKILNRAKPKLFQNYLQKTEVHFVDLLFNPSMEEDVEMLCQAVHKMKEFPAKMKIVVLSSLLSWAQTDLERVRDVSQFMGLESYVEPNAPKSDDNASQQDQADGDQDEPAPTVSGDPQEPQARMDPRHFRLRQPSSEYEARKILEDKLAELSKINENVEVHIVYTGLIYGKEHFILKEYFRKAWLGEPLPLHEDDDLNQYKIPTVELDFLVSSVFKIIEDDSLQPQNNKYDDVPKALEKLEAARAVVKERAMSHRASNTSQEKMEGEEKVSEGDSPKKETEEEQLEKVETLLSTNRAEESQTPQEPPAEATVDPREGGSEEDVLQLPNTLRVYFLFEPKVYSYTELIEKINVCLGSGRVYEEDSPDFEFPEMALFDFNVALDPIIAKLFEEASQDFTTNLVTSARDFCRLNQLKPIRILLNKEFTYSLNVAKNLAAAYRVPLINVEWFVKELVADQYFQAHAENLVEGDLDCFETLTEQPDFIKKFDFSQDRNAAEFIFKLLKYRLGLNDCLRKGYVLVNYEKIFGAFGLKDLLYTNQFSKGQFEKEIEKKKKAHLLRLERERKRIEKMERIRVKKEEKERLHAERLAKLAEEKAQREADEARDVHDGGEDGSNAAEDQPTDRQSAEEEPDPQTLEEKNEETPEDQEPEEDEKSEEEPTPADEEGEETPPTTREDFFPQHFVILTHEDSLNPGSKHCFDFVSKKRLPYCLKTIDLKGSNEDKKTIPELSEDIVQELRVYIERVS